MHINKYLLAGISALARRKNQFNYPWFFVHSRASVLAGYFMLADNDLSEDVRNAIEVYLDEVIASDKLRFSHVSYDSSQADRE